MSVKKDLTVGTFYMAISKYSGILVSLVVASILSRILTPSEYGVVGVATVFIAFFNILGDCGIGPAIIQNKDLNKHDINYIFTLTIYLAIGLSLLFFVLSFPIALFYNNDILKSVCQLLSLNIFFTCVNIVPLNLQYKKKKFKDIAFISLSAQIIGGVVGIIMAMNEYGVYALAISSIIPIFLQFIIFELIEKVKFSFIISKSSIKKIYSFSIFTALFNIINYFSRNLDKLLIGKYIGMEPLGYYEKSYRLMMMPLQNISSVITPAIIPSFSDIQDNLKEVSTKYLKLIQILGYIAFPISVIVFFCSKELILIIFGNQWYQAILPLKILSFTIGLQILNSISGSIYMSIGATKQLFISGCWCALFLTSSFFITVFIWKEIEAVSYGFLIAQICNNIQTFYFLTKALRVKTMDVYMRLVRPLVIGCLLFVSMHITLAFIQSDSQLISLFIKASIGILFTAIFIHIISPYNLIKVLNIRYLLNIFR